MALLREIRNELRGLRADLAERKRGVLAPADLAKLKLLLPAIYADISDLSFTVASLQESVDLVPGAPLRQALATCGAGRAIGKLLRRGAGHDIECLRLHQVGNDSTGNVWMVQKGAEKHERHALA